MYSADAQQTYSQKRVQRPARDIITLGSEVADVVASGATPMACVVDTVGAATLNFEEGEA